MIKSSDISGRFWNQPQKAVEERAREQTFIDDILDFCYEYDSSPYVAGLGKDNIAAVADV